MPPAATVDIAAAGAPTVVAVEVEVTVALMDMDRWVQTQLRCGAMGASEVSGPGPPPTSPMTRGHGAVPRACTVGALVAMSRASAAPPVWTAACPMQAQTVAMWPP